MRQMHGWMGAVALLAANPAWGAETWWGGNVTTGLQLVEGTGVGTILSQAELDFRASTGPVFFRVDLDYHFDPFFFGEGLNEDYTLAPHYPLPPEYALVQIGSKYHVRLGVTNPDFGLQEWDEKDNYLPSYTNGWDLANGQNLGIEPGITFDDGTDLFVFGGYDMAWLAPSFGAGVQYEGDWFGTWSGFFFLPTYPYGMLYSANEIYPFGALYFSLEPNIGYVDGDIVGGGQIVAQLFPESVVGGAIRVDKQFYTDHAARFLEVDVDAFAVSAAVRVDPTDYLHFALEGKESWPRGEDADPYFTGTFLVSAFVPGEPYDDFAVHEEEEAE